MYHSHALMMITQNMAAETAAYLTAKHPDYAVLAAGIAVSLLHKEAKKHFPYIIADLYNYGMLIYFVRSLVSCF